MSSAILLTSSHSFPTPHHYHLQGNREDMIATFLLKDNFVSMIVDTLGELCLVVYLRYLNTQHYCSPGGTRLSHTRPETAESVHSDNRGDDRVSAGSFTEALQSSNRSLHRKTHVHTLRRGKHF